MVRNHETKELDYPKIIHRIKKKHFKEDLRKLVIYKIVDSWVYYYYFYGNPWKGGDKT